MAIGPVCKMTVDGKTTQWRSEHEGKTYYLCAPRCKKMFDKDPSKFLKK